MNDINWEEGAVFYANEQQHPVGSLITDDVIAYVLLFDDFQLNEIKQGDFISTSELGTEGKYINVIEVLGLFGYYRGGSYLQFKESSEQWADFIICGNDMSVWASREEGKRKLTYEQIMTIGRLKLAMIQRDSQLVCGKPKEEFVTAINKVNTLEGVLCTPQATSDCKELNLNLVITGEWSYVLDCINGVEYQVETLDDYNKVVGAIRVLQERER